jgi:radical SAM superfamily enzyme YgiQ (UPF0313 family)
MPVLLVNPPLVEGVAFTREGRCQEPEDVLGTTKPPYTLALAAALLRDQQIPFRIVDLTAERRTVASLGDELVADGFKPDTIVFSSTVPTLEADCSAVAALRARFPSSQLICFGPHASAAPRESLMRAPAVDVMIVGEPEDAIVALGMGTTLDRIDSIARRVGDRIRLPEAPGRFAGFLTMPYPAWDLLPLRRYRLPLIGTPYVIVETSRGCPYTCDFCVAPLHHGHSFRQRSAQALADEIERGRRELGVRNFYLWGDTVTLNASAFSAFCDELIARKLDVRWFGNARADNLVDPAFVRQLRRSGCWMLGMGIESASAATRRQMIKRLDEDAIRTAFINLRQAGIRSLGFFIFGYPGDTRASMAASVAYALDLDADFVNFYPAVPYPGTRLYDTCVREGLLTSDDWSRMEYSHYLLRGPELDERVVLEAIARARRDFYLRPRYLVRHIGDAIRLTTTKPGFALRFLRSLRRPPSIAAAQRTS